MYNQIIHFEIGNAILIAIFSTGMKNENQYPNINITQEHGWRRNLTLTTLKCFCINYEDQGFFSSWNHHNHDNWLS